MDIINILQQEFNVSKTQIENTIKLIDEGNTIPFIARYRKELTGSLDDQILRQINERLSYIRNLEEKKKQIEEALLEQGNLTDDIKKALDNAATITEADDIYRPFRPKRKTRASVAKEKGLGELADIILAQKEKIDIYKYAEKFINEEKGVSSLEDALQGAMDIVAEDISDNAQIRKNIRNEIFKNGSIITKAVDENTKSVYEMYYDYSENIKKIAPHRVLAVNRGEKEGFLTVKVESDGDKIFSLVSKAVIHKNSPFEEILGEIIKDSIKRLILPSVEREIRNEITETAEEKAIDVFGKNLKQLLMQPPIKDKTVLAIDPAFRTGCKTAVVDKTGKPLETCVIYPTPPQNKVEEAKKKVISLIDKYDVDVISIGNGTASRETESFVAELIKESKKNVSYVIVNEAGASVYSASKLGAEEFPDYDVSLRSAVSIGRRLQDPLAELVKIDPESIGVGQYQHDMNKKRLSETLKGVVEDCVNKVGVDLNTASAPLLSYVSGISPAVSKNIVTYREENGKFLSRKELLNVSKLGPKAFEQCAGFLRISESKEAFDNTGVHPESYKAAEELLKITGFTKDDLKNKNVKGIKNKIGNMEETAKTLGIGVYTLEDIINDIEKPGRDPRDDMPKPVLRTDVLEMTDLKEGMVLKGTVRNVIDFGVFVDIGVHQDGLVHISQITDKFIKHPLEVLKVGDIVDVKVLSVDLEKKRISLTMRF
jgi:uncharacterized protein